MRFITLKECQDVLNEAARAFQNSNTSDKAKRAVANTQYTLLLEYKNKRNNFGQCQWDRETNTHGILINGSLMSNMSKEDFQDTCRHEFAHFIVHALCSANLLKKNVRSHGAEWKAVCLLVGARPRTHTKSAKAGVCGLAGYLIDNKKNKIHAISLKTLNKWKKKGAFKSGRWTIKAADRSEIMDPKIFKDLEKFKL